MSIENKLTYLESTKDAIKQAIVDKGVSVSDSDTFRSYATKIGEIQGGSGELPKNTLYIGKGANSPLTVANVIKKVVLPSGLTNINSMYGCFSNCTSLTSISLPELPIITDMGYCFYKCSSLTNITYISLSTVMDMTNCFAECHSISSISLLDISNVTNMSSCFAYCSSLTNITLPSSLPNVTNMSNCFAFCSSLNSITLPSSLPNVTNMSSCFAYCRSLTNITLPELPKAKNIYKIFNECSSFEEITLKSMPNVTSYMNLFFYCTNLKNLSISDISPNITTLTNWYISNCTALTVDSLVNIMNALPTITSTKTCTIGTTNISKLSAEQLAIGTSKGWSIN